MHSYVDTLERVEILRDLRLGRFDVLVGINLLREGLDLPEVSLVAILDADKEGFLRSNTSLIQTIGRAARNVSGSVILYADKITKSMQAAMEETARRRAIQMAYNKEHHIVPQTINKAVKDILGMVSSGSRTNEEASHTKGETTELDDSFFASPEERSRMDIAQLRTLIDKVEEAMLKAASEMQFETAAALRDQMYSLKRQLSSILEGLPAAAALELAESDKSFPLKRRKKTETAAKSSVATDNKKSRARQRKI